MSDPYYLGRLTKMNNRLLETIDANKKKKGYTVNESGEDRKSTRLNSSHITLSYAVFC